MPYDAGRHPARSELVTLPFRTAFLLLLLWIAYTQGDTVPVEASRTDTGQGPITARFDKSGRPWRTVQDRDRDGRWDVWIDERNGRPFVVSVDTNADGRPDRDNDESGSAMSLWRAASLRASKSAAEFFQNSKQVQYTGLAVTVYIFLEFAARAWMRPRS